MQARRRYLVVLLGLGLLALWLASWRRRLAPHPRSSYVGALTEQVPRVAPMGPACRMETCFDLARCRRRGFSVYVYPPSGQAASPLYLRMLEALRSAGYPSVSHPSLACIRVLATDTLDRDNLSADFKPEVPLPPAALWEGGRNHVIFNLYSGTWPHYREDALTGLDPGQAILARASVSVATYRPGFDVALPLFGRKHPPAPSGKTMRAPPLTSPRLLVFKGKRYVHGIGSATRNALYHLHNGRDIVLLTTCRHGKRWREMRDPRCEIDNANYDKYDYQALMENATFCLVPRGRRLGSFRFLESLQAGCVPVVLSNGWELPFSEVIDWTQAAVRADERLLLQVPDILRSIPPEKIFAMRQQTQVLWEAYFSSLDKIVLTTMEIIRERVFPRETRPGTVWNSWPGGLAVLPSFSQSPGDFPFFLQGSEPRAAGFTAVVYCTLPAGPALFRLLRNVSASAYVARILVVWNLDQPPPSKWPSSRVALTVVHPKQKTISSRFLVHPHLTTDAVFSLDEDVTLITEELDFAYRVWRTFPDRIVGYPARSHYWDESRGQWAYTSKWTNTYSVVLPGAAVYHRYWHHAYHAWPGLAESRALVDRSHNCEDLLLNFLTAHVTRRPPIKLTQRKRYASRGSPSRWADHDHFSQRQACLNDFVRELGYMPLVRSSSRLDPVFYRDPVSALRKRYRRLELVPAARR